MYGSKAYSIEKDTIVINRGLTKLDLFVKDFLKVLKKNSDYLVVSGFVSISCGRARGTEDVDVLVPVLPKERFIKLFADLEKLSFWCYQGDSAEEAYSYVRNLDDIRFARKNELFPNIEFVPFDKTKKAKFFEFNHPQKIRIKDFEFKIPPLEFEILYKELVLKGEKDIEDAKHLRSFFCEILKEEKFTEYEPIVKAELK